jgi:multidrug efflux pump subunit AcrA (membrane-fusion protein)
MKKRIALICLVLGTLAGCSSRQEGIAGASRVPVKVARPKRLEAPAVVAVSGSVVAPDNPSNVAFLVSGKVVKVGPREGEFVQRG